jgi:hypothetical protein
MLHKYRRLNQDKVDANFSNMWQLKATENALESLKESLLKTEGERNALQRVQREFRNVTKQILEGNHNDTIGKRYVQTNEIATQTMQGPLPGRVIGRGNMMKKQAEVFESNLRKLKAEYEATLEKAVQLNPLNSTILNAKSLTLAAPSGVAPQEPKEAEMNYVRSIFISQDRLIECILSDLTRVSV